MSENGAGSRPAIRYAAWIIVPAVCLIGLVIAGLNWPTALGLQILVCAAVFAWWLVDHVGSMAQPVVAAVVPAVKSAAATDPDSG